MKLAIIGSRTAAGIDVAAHIPAPPDVIVSGGARGADSLAAEYARANGIPLETYLPEYDKYGRGAPLVRNRSIVDACDEVLAFWDGQSRGTKNALDYARKLGKGIRIVWADEEDMMV